MTKPLHPLRGAQRDASHPQRHVWLAASAGTGKTQVLAARVFRLLLAGSRPEAILCLTFTKAGAAEMAERIAGTLARWVRLDRNDLFNELRGLGEPATPEQVERARTLFARVLDAPGGLRIQTIHGFCQSLLAAFPAEAGLVPGFRPLEPREQALLRREALARLLEDEAREGRVAIAEAIGALALRLGEQKAEMFLHACAARPDAMEALPIGESIRPYIRRALDLPTGDIDAEIEASCGDDRFDLESLREIAAANAAWGTKTGLERADAIAAWLAGDARARAAGLADLHLVWATGKGELRKKPVAPGDAYAALAERLHGHCGELLALKVRAGYADALASALTAGRAYARAYADAKRLAGAVDFDDLIAATVRLLETEGMGEWVRYKLDLATEHVLIDEAQDTNLAQWRIVKAIADEFFAGAGTRGNRVRTLFTVGDDKQAIFGFQGTDPIFFRAAQLHFDRLGAAPPIEAEERRPLETVALTESFRSVATVLRFVDAALDALPAPGMGTDERQPHASQVPGPGSVTLLPPVVAGGSEEDEEGWVDDQVRELARRIARQVREWIDGGHMLASKGRALRPEDVMILVKRRGELASLIVARLYAEGVPVAGVDRLRLNAPLAVQDLLAAIRFVLQPGDDLSLASLLVSPLIGWSQDELMAAAMHRKGSLWRHLRATQASERLAPLYHLLARADFATPYRFLEDILSGQLDGRRRLIARLGEEARDPIEELLSAALGFERNATPSLQRFLDWFDRGEVEIVRDSSRPQAAVRVMTAHGAKGLQAPLVILADATADPTQNRRDLFDWQADEDRPPLPVFRPRSAERGGPLDAVVADSDRRELEEHWRLFYVAATRAEEQLVIAGSLSERAKGEPPPLSWYRASAMAMDALGVPPGEVRVLADDRLPAPAIVRPAEASTATALPDWARRPAPEEARPPRPLAPSSLGEDEIADPPPAGPAMQDAAERGRLLHGLFERLPALPPEHRRAAGEAWLAGNTLGDGLVDRTLSIIGHPDFADLFGPDALAEAPVAAIVDGQVVAGTVDRLLVGADRIRLIDFKTGRRVPSDAGEVPLHHQRQMAAYAAALAVIFPNRPIEAALLYTAGPRLIALAPETLAALKPGFVVTEQSLPSRA
ncbi:double-strand break repair helicase AddA [Sphingomonas spermidinifaciens]|uniref:DNA 3'-5' helicase n=1 Tax=Sphingomonas spermidinifaciens TaxID=1141889 RepID=A0A2A4B563_9SPHN|nr:double-strand break repair helicase AddA [Sphingomonas spermidinifaciens]PCD03581.1 double-strand break repair helicase AddA [Sphingomonas spermidinifaciens]